MSMMRDEGKKKSNVNRGENNEEQQETTRKRGLMKLGRSFRGSKSNLFRRRENSKRNLVGTENNNRRSRSLSRERNQKNHQRKQDKQASEKKEITSDDASTSSLGTSSSARRRRRKSRDRLQIRELGDDGATTATSNTASMDEDPVIALFQARSKQRVRFALEGDVPTRTSPGTNNTLHQPQPHPPLSLKQMDSRQPLMQGQSRSTPNAPTATPPSQFNIKSFMGRVLFNKRVYGVDAETDDDDDEENMVGKARELMRWEAKTNSKRAAALKADLNQMKDMLQHSPLMDDAPPRNDLNDDKKPSASDVYINPSFIFVENPQVQQEVQKLLSKARRAQLTRYRYAYAVKCCIKAHELLVQNAYPSHHASFQQTLEQMHHSHHALSCFQHSAKIVKMGLKYEQSGEYVRALKMYTIAYRIRRDQLSASHPSLVVLLNILGSIQIKRGEYDEAMQIYHLCFKGGTTRSKDGYAEEEDDDDGDARGSKSSNSTGNQNTDEFTHSNLLARAVSYRDMGTIHEAQGNPAKALEMYHKSIQSVEEWKESSGKKKKTPTINNSGNGGDVLCSLDNVQLTQSLSNINENSTNNVAGQPDQVGGEMEVFLGSAPPATKPSTLSRKRQGSSKSTTPSAGSGMNVSVVMAAGGDASIAQYYLALFPEPDPKRNKKKMISPSTGGTQTYADIDLSVTLHQIAQMHQRLGQYGKSLDGYRASLKGMKHALGDYHPNVAAILGNMGNLLKEMGDLDAAYETYQQVLGIESYRLGVSHPEVAISLHNVATIEAERRNYNQAIHIYEKVLALQKKLFGQDHLSTATTAACLGDVHEKRGDLGLAMFYFEETLHSKTNVLGRHHLQVARVLHKLGKTAFKQENYNLADSYTSRALLIYRLNRLGDEHEWVIDAHRDCADIDAAIALGSGNTFEC